MKTNPIVPVPSAAGGWDPSWGNIAIGAMLPALFGGGYALAALMGMFGKKDKKMTKLEKTCLGFVIAICERLSDLERQKEDLTKQVTDAESKLRNAETIAETHVNEADARTKEVEQRLTTTSDQLKKAQVQIEELGLKLATKKRRARGRP